MFKEIGFFIVYLGALLPLGTFMVIFCIEYYGVSDAAEIEI